MSYDRILIIGPEDFEKQKIELFNMLKKDELDLIVLSENSNENIIPQKINLDFVIENFAPIELDFPIPQKLRHHWYRKKGNR